MTRQVGSEMFIVCRCQPLSPTTPTVKTLLFNCQGQTKPQPSEPQQYHIGDPTPPYSLDCQSSLTNQLRSSLHHRIDDNSLPIVFHPRKQNRRQQITDCFPPPLAESTITACQSFSTPAIRINNIGLPIVFHPREYLSAESTTSDHRSLPIDFKGLRPSGCQVGMYNHWCCWDDHVSSNSPTAQQGSIDILITFNIVAVGRYGPM
ncbi:hypothetical protein PGT21_020177 [Puccinia graminis f. sp. tritici]|uniref:Uncharacterized protein n=1 Tax=Puccinia graminis f. sp. tritici TaxID=56615 RepID=A0A5B0QN66_PUCGR|nr:hypothetical protein PGT21_020177 [Puccinia graminis f. sp. tritici]